MGEQSWRQVVHGLAGPEKDPDVYDFHGRSFQERRFGGAYDGDNGSNLIDGAILIESGDYLLTESGSYVIIE